MTALGGTTVEANPPQHSIKQREKCGLVEELATSELSGKAYRSDQETRCAVSGRLGHKSEFIECFETRQPIALSESERCEITGKRVRKGVLEICAETRARALRSEFDRCSVTGKRVLKRILVQSSASQALLLKRLAIRSSKGDYCLPTEARECFWSKRVIHPDDLRVCVLTGLSVHAEFIASGDNRLRALGEMLDGVRRSADEEAIWSDIAEKLSAALNGKKCRIEAAVVSPTRRHVAISSEIKTLLGMRIRHAGAIYDLSDRSIIGRVTAGKRGAHRWEAEAS